MYDEFSDKVQILTRNSDLLARTRNDCLRRQVCIRSAGIVNSGYMRSYDLHFIFRDKIAECSGIPVHDLYRAVSGRSDMQYIQFALLQLRQLIFKRNRSHIAGVQSNDERPVPESLRDDVQSVYLFCIFLGSGPEIRCQQAGLVIWKDSCIGGKVIRSCRKIESRLGIYGIRADRSTGSTDLDLRRSHRIAGIAFAVDVDHCHLLLEGQIDRIVCI